MSKSRILLTGGNGMVGRNLLDHPDIGEFDVVAPSSAELNLCDFDAVEAFLARHTPDMVIHAAGRVGGIQANIAAPVGFLLDNLDMGRNIVWAARRAGITQLINLGSSCMYPRNHVDPLREEQVLTGELEPTNEGYALAKITTARLCAYVAQEDAAFAYKTLIPCNLYGPHDKFDPAHSHLIPAVIHKIHHAKLNGEPTVEIWGDGKARREFMYAGDFADALICAVRMFDSLPGMMNVGLGHDYSINDYYQAAAEVIGYTGDFVHNLDRPVGMARKLVCVDRQRSWGWNAQTSLRSGIEQTYAFYLGENPQ